RVVLAVEVSPDDFVLEVVALGDEPGPAGQVVPPLPAHARLALAVEHIIGPLGIGRRRGIGHGADLAAEGEFLEGPQSVNGAAQEFHERQPSPDRSRWISILLLERSRRTGIMTVDIASGKNGVHAAGTRRASG